MVNDDDCDSDRIPQQVLGVYFGAVELLFLIFSAPCLNRTTLFFNCSAYFVNCAAYVFLNCSALLLNCAALLLNSNLA